MSPIWLFFPRAPTPPSTREILSKLDYSYIGRVFCYVPAKDSIDLLSLDYSYQASPFVSFAEED